MKLPWGHEEALKALILDQDKEVLPKLGMMCPDVPLPWMSAVCDHAIVEMVVSQLPSGVLPLGVAPLEDVLLGIPLYPNTLRADMDVVIEEWRHKTDMPRIRYEYER